MSDVLPALNQARGFTPVRKIDAKRGAVDGIAVSDDGALVTVTHHGDDSVSVIDTASGAVTLTVTEVGEPLAVVASGRRAYIGTVAAAHDEILAFDTASQRIVGTYPVEFGVTDLAVSPNGRYVYAGRSGADGADVTIVDTSTGKQGSIPIAAATINCVRVSRDGGRMYLAANSAFTAELVTIDVQRMRVAGIVEIGSPIRDIALSPDGAVAYVGSCGLDASTLLDTVHTRNLTIQATHKIDGAAGTLAQLTVSRGGDRVYLVGDRCVTVLSAATQEMLGSITVGDQPSCAAESPDGRRLYVADYAGAVTELEIAASAARVDALTSDDDLTAPRAWTFSDLLALEPTPV